MGLFGRDDSPQPGPPAQTPSRTVPAQPAGDTTVIARSCEIEGTLTGTGDVTIQGRFKGNVDGSGKLFIAEGGKAEARLHARNIVVAGTVKGDVSADEKIELQPSAQLRGNITAPRILIQEGATFEGQVFMKKPVEKPAASTPDKPKIVDPPATQGSKKPEPGQAKKD
jgi:cytoskeletal protein CcmA (bactofilin family)